jgi:hypothetical protein
MIVERMNYSDTVTPRSEDAMKYLAKAIPVLFLNINLVPTMPKEHSRYNNWLWAGRLRGRSSRPGRVKNFLFSKSSRPALGPTQPPIQWVLGALSPMVKRSGREADHSPPTSAEVKKMRIYKSTPPYALMA